MLYYKLRVVIIAVRSVFKDIDCRLEDIPNLATIPRIGSLAAEMFEMPVRKLRDLAF